MTQSRDTTWVVFPEDPGWEGAYVPTKGHPTSASDMYRVAGIHESGHEGWNSCFTDQHTCAALGRLIEGPLSSVSEIRSSEEALQALLLHDRVDVMVGGFKYARGNLIGYARQEDTRSNVVYDLFQKAQAYDHIFAVEKVRVDDQTIAESSLINSPVLGSSLTEAKAHYLARSDMQRAAMASVPLHFGVPAYFTDPGIEPFAGRRGMLGEFYTQVCDDWASATGSVPDFSVSVPVPPLLAVVLDRSANRNAIPATIAALRDELAPVRREMLGFTEMLNGALNQKQLEERCRYLKESFAAAVPASRKSGSILLPLLKLYRSARSPLDAVIKALNPDYKPDDPRILANRTVTGRVFSQLLKTDAVQSMMRYHFTPAEIRAVEQSHAEPSSKA